jgi:hypothetical protein
MLPHINDPGSHFSLLRVFACVHAVAGHGLPPALAAPGGAVVLDQLHAMQAAQAAAQAAIRAQLAAMQAQLAAMQAQLAAMQAQLAAMQAAAQDVAVPVGHRLDALENVEARRVSVASCTAGVGPLW